MIAVDTNILVYAHREELPLHEKAKAKIIELAESPEPWALPVFCITEFIRVVTHPKLFDPPSGLPDVLDAIGSLLESPSLIILNPGENFWTMLNEIAKKANTRGNLLFDAQIAAVCKEHGIKDLLSEDRDFARFDCIILHSL